MSAFRSDKLSAAARFSSAGVCQWPNCEKSDTGGKQPSVLQVLQRVSSYCILSRNARFVSKCSTVQIGFDSEHTGCLQSSFLGLPLAAIVVGFPLLRQALRLFSTRYAFMPSEHFVIERVCFLLGHIPAEESVQHVACNAKFNKRIAVRVQTKLSRRSLKKYRKVQRNTPWGSAWISWWLSALYRWLGMTEWRSHTQFCWLEIIDSKQWSKRPLLCRHVAADLHTSWYWHKQ
jgi:hypothetical protein